MPVTQWTRAFCDNCATLALRFSLCSH